VISRNSIKYYLLIILVFSVGSKFVVHSTDFNSSFRTNNKDNLLLPFLSSSQSYAVHAPILVISDGGFSSYNFNGVGTRENPYLIEGYNITSHGSKH
jgi:hypothetical protein